MSLPEPEVVHVPDLGSSHPIRVGEWLVECGDTVCAGERLVELVIPGFVYEVTAQQDGVVVAIELPTGNMTQTGAALARIAANGSLESDED